MDSTVSRPGIWILGGETVITAARREALEEVGVRIEPQDIEFSSVMHRMNAEERVDFFVQILKWEGEPANAEPDKCDEIRWVSRKDLPDNTIPYIRAGTLQSRAEDQV